MAIFFTSDQHLGHQSVLTKFEHRPFKDLDEMREEIIERWNRKVKKSDLVYSLGDMFWKGDCDYVQDTLKRLNGSIILMKGNHDRWLHNAGNKKLLAGIKDYDEIEVILKGGTVKRCILSHYPIHFYNVHYHGAIMLYGHTHTTHEDKMVQDYAKWLNEHNCPVEMYNVGCMHWNYEPVTLDEILERCKSVNINL